jgi:hypothetical protein
METEKVWFLPSNDSSLGPLHVDSVLGGLHGWALQQQSRNSSLEILVEWVCALRILPCLLFDCCLTNWWWRVSGVMVICSLLTLIFSPNLFLLSLNLQQFQVGVSKCWMQGWEPSAGLEFDCKVIGGSTWSQPRGSWAVHNQTCAHTLKSSKSPKRPHPYLIKSFLICWRETEARCG